MLFTCHLYVIRMLFLCTRLSFICHSYVIVCHLYAIRMSVECARRSFACHSNMLVCHSYVTCLWFYHEPYTIPSRHIQKYLACIKGNVVMKTGNVA